MRLPFFLQQVRTKTPVHNSLLSDDTIFRNSSLIDQTLWGRDHKVFCTFQPHLRYTIPPRQYSPSWRRLNDCWVIWLCLFLRRCCCFFFFIFCPILYLKTSVEGTLSLKGVLYQITFLYYLCPGSWKTLLCRSREQLHLPGERQRWRHNQN